MKYTKDEKAVIWLDSFTDLEYKLKRGLLERAKTPYELVANFSENKKYICDNASESVYNNMYAALFDEKYLTDLINGYEQKQIFAVTCASQNYPVLLKQTSAPPVALYCKGNASLLNERKFAIVGSRKTLQDAAKRTSSFSKSLSKHFCIVTGLAEGGDCAAIDGALDSGRVISVLAYGFNYVYPKQHEALQKRIAEKGLLITEHLPETAPRNYLFLVRNRIIAGLCEGVLVVSAGEKSGALSTANYAMEYGREVYAFPYSIGQQCGSGCNALIKSGAKLCDNLVDIEGDFGLDLTADDILTLTDDEKSLLDLLKDGPVHISELAARSSLQQGALLSRLSMLEIKGVVIKTTGNFYAAL